MAKSDRPFAPSASTSDVRPLPPRANLEHLKNQAKQRLIEMRRSHPGTKLADAQHAVARQYGFRNWRDLKAHLDRYRLPSDRQKIDAIVRAVRERDVARVQALLREDRTLVNAKDAEGRSLLLIAANAEHHGAAPSLVDLLRAHEPLLIDLHTAAALGMTDVVAKGLDAEPARIDEADKGGMTPLLWAAHGHHGATARLLLERGANPNVREATGWTPLHLAAEWGDAATLKALLRRGADADAILSSGEKPIHVAAKLRHTDAVNVLLQHGQREDIWLAAALGRVDLLERLGGDLDAPLPGNAGYRPLQLAAQAGHDAAVDWLLNQGVDLDALSALRLKRYDYIRARAAREPGWIDQADSEGVTPLHRCAAEGLHEALRVLIVCGASLNPKDSRWSATPLGWAKEVGDTEAFAVLRDAGAKLGTELAETGEASPELLKAFGEAIYRDRGDIEAVAKLLDEHPQLVNSRPWAPQYPQTAIEAVAGMCVWHRPKMHAIAKLLVERGAEADLPTLARCGLVDEVRRRVADDPSRIDRPDDKGRTALYRAACVYGGFEEGEAVADLLIARGAAIDIHTACTFGMIDRVRELLAADRSLANAEDGDGMRPLHWAVRVRRNAENAPAIVRMLCEAGADVEAANRQEDGMHPLHHCGEWMSEPEVADVLIEHGADINAPAEQNGWTPLDYAVDRRREAMIAYLEREGGERSRVEDLMVRAVLRGDAWRLKRLLDQHPEKMAAATGGPWDKPLLHLAAWEGHAEIVDELLKRGVDPNTRCRTDNAYALHFAAEKGRLDIVRRLVDAGGDIHGDGDDHQMGVLGWATCLHGYHEDVAEFLLERGARLHIFSAVAMNRIDDVRRMVRADPTLLEAKMSRNEHHRRPLHLAVLRNRPEMVRLLLELGADVHAADDTGATALTCATEAAAPAVLAVLQSAGAKVDLISALRLKRYDLAEALLREDPARLGPAGHDTIALHLSAHAGDADAVRWLIAHGVDVNAKRVLWDCNHTALHVCAEHDRPEIAALLLAGGADPTIADDKYHSPPLGWAHHLNRPRMVRLLEMRGRR